MEKRKLFTNAHVIALVVGTIVVVLTFDLLWPYCPKEYLGLLYFGAFILEWLIVQFTQRVGSSWRQKRYNIAHLCCYFFLAVNICLCMIDRPFFPDGPKALLSPAMDSILLTVVITFFCVAYNFIIGSIIIKYAKEYAEHLKEYPLNGFHQFYDHGMYF